MKKGVIYRILLGLAALTLVLFIVGYITGHKEILGPLLISFFVLLAFGVRGNAIGK
jgi:uncharacterized membrane protein YccC